jgi:hypothetical protein
VRFRALLGPEAFQVLEDNNFCPALQGELHYLPGYPVRRVVVEVRYLLPQVAGKSFSGPTAGWGIPARKGKAARGCLSCSG